MKPLHAVDHFFKNRVLSSFGKDNSANIINAVRADIRGVTARPLLVAEVACLDEDEGYSRAALAHMDRNEQDRIERYRGE